MSVVTPDELSDRTNNDDVIVLDIRSSDEYRDWHIPESKNIDVYSELKNDRETAKQILSELPRDKEIVTVCAAGKLSQTATEVLQELGYEAATLQDGMTGWSRVHQHANVDVDIDGALLQVARPGKGCLSYVLVSDGEAAVFDPSSYVEIYEEIAAGRDAEITAVYDTHAHADHVSGGKRLAERSGAPYHLHPRDAVSITAEPVRDGDTHRVGNVEIDVIHTPGHSPGGVSYHVGGVAVLTGDTLFHDSVGRVELGVEAGLEETDTMENAETLYRSLQRLQELPGATVVLPAHDPGSPTPPVQATLDEVQERNRDLQLPREEFVDKLSSDVPDHPPNFERVKRANVGLEDVPKDELRDLETGPNRCAAE